MFSSAPLAPLCANLERAGVPFHRLGSPGQGEAIVVQAGGRVLGLSAPGGRRNAFWVHPMLASCRNAEDIGRLGAGGMGGLRLWQAPEAAYMWDGQADLATFSNYRVQPAMDPGVYAWGERSATRCALSTAITLRDYGTNARVTFSVRRIIELARVPANLGAKVARGLTLRFQHHIRLLDATDAAAKVDLWHLLQLPAGAIVGARVRPDARPVSYFNTARIGPLTSDHGFLQWPTNGTRLSKIGISVHDAMGGPYSISHGGDTLACFLWNVPRWPSAPYVDAPPGLTATDQLLQFWDGFDFCEIEYHTPGLSLESPEAVDASELIYVEAPSADCTPLELLQRIHL
jgi:hypothetical protein